MSHDGGLLSDHPGRLIEDVPVDVESAGLFTEAWEIARHRDSFPGLCLGGLDAEQLGVVSVPGKVQVTRIPICAIFPAGRWRRRRETDCGPGFGPRALY